MDLNSIKPKETVKVEINHPATGEPLGLSVEMRSRHDNTVKEKVKSIELRGGKLTPAQRLAVRDAWAREILVSAAVGWEWSNDLEFDSDPSPEFSDAMMTRVLSEYPFIFEQLNEQFGDISAFFSK
ncbi:hypothetical protein [Pseudovibrio sp. POLY-S9]|uniref:hypothetical protein n=1 Tax=Pseudovibrio sp. POLY-S9 TaxID=1576596 RepID=UPI0007094D1E|nr:hypothetical protein [Pseudovibrio sp. POLY-S9]